MWHAVGVFTANFLYAIAGLARVDRRGSTKVRLISSWVVIGLLKRTVAMFVGLIQRIGVGFLQINRILSLIGDWGRKVIDTVCRWPEEFRSFPTTQT